MHILEKEYIKILLESRRELFFDCWLYNQKLHHSGYGFIEISDKPYLVHRLALWVYEDFNLDSPLKVLHKVECAFKHCFSPDHLYAGTQKENMQDAMYLRRGGAYAQSIKTHCPHGHEYIEEITRFRRGKRECRTCENIRYEAKKALINR